MVAPNIQADLVRDARAPGDADVTFAYERFGLLQGRREIEALLGLLRPKKRRYWFLEIGVYRGGTFWLFSKTFLDGGIGIDLPGGVGGRDLTAEDFENRRQAFRDYEILEADSHSELTRDRVKIFLSGSPLDFVFIDGDHSYEGVRRDYELYRPLVREDGGIVAFHDVVYSEYHEKAGCQVGRFWRELDGDKLELVTPGRNWGGIGVLFV